MDTEQAEPIAGTSGTGGYAGTGASGDHDGRTGLTSAEVNDRISRGLVNTIRMPRSKTIGQIIADNVLTPFILINIIIFVMILLTGRLVNTLFMGVVVSNVLIGIIQEIRAKRVVDRLSVITAIRASVIRDGAEQQIPLEKLVLDDVYILRPGNQVCTDGAVLDSAELEVDESLLTGEPEPVIKLAGDTVLSGSFVVAGGATVRTVHIGQDNYAQKITAAARRYKKANSEILTILNRVIKTLALIILPAGLLLFASQYFRNQATWQDAVVSSAAGMIGMIPEGLILLTSVTLAVGIIKLARQRAVVQDLPGMEVLARVDVLCLDKTGTLTTGSLKVSQAIPLGEFAADQIMAAAAAVVGGFKELNSTSLALSAFLPDDPGWPAIRKVPFSSSRGWSGISFTSQGTWIAGAPERLLGNDFGPVLDQVRSYAGQGIRVIVLAYSPEELSADLLPPGLRPAALFLLADVVRPEAAEALRFFLENDVAIKIISGDNPATVAAIAGQLQLPGAERYIDAEQIADNPADLAKAAQDFTIFGRVTPWRKQQLISALQAGGHVVAMTGDGVNDVLALREADCSIVMASGSDAAKNTAHIILLDSDFTVLPSVVSEGRQVINNIERVASLFLVKTTYSLLLTVIFIMLGQAYPFYPVHQTVLGGVSIGIPAFFLALEKNTRRIQPGFLGKILQQAIPAGICITVSILVIRLLQELLRIDAGQIRIISVVVTGIIGLQVIYRVSRPLNLRRLLLIAAMAALFLAEMIVFASWLEFPRINGQSALIILGLSILAYPAIILPGRLFQKKKY